MLHIQNQLKTSRRSLLVKALKGSAIIATGILPLMGCSNGKNKKTQSIASGEFKHGVASGDPATDAVILWTRITPSQNNNPEEDVPVNWEVASDINFSQIVNAGNATAKATRDFTFKIDAQGLEPGSDY